MAWEYEGLFDAIPTEGDDLLSSYWRSEETEIRVGSMGYRTATIKAGDRLEAEIYPIFGRAKEKTVRAAKKNITKERQFKLNIYNAKRKLILLLEENFDLFKDDMITLTYVKEPESLKRCKMDVRNFLLRVKRFREKNGLPEMKYLIGYGHDVNQRMHVHVVMTGGVGILDLVEIWKRGIVNGYMLQDFGQGMEGAANYLYKQNENEKRAGNRVNYHMWSGSRNLKQPKEHKSDSRVSNRKVKLLSRSFGADAKEVLEKVYPGYTLKECVMRFSDIVDGVYIKCIMRKKEADPWKKLKNTDSTLTDNLGKAAGRQRICS